VRLVGLTGGIGSGKSTVAGLLAERGAEVIDADAIAREVLEPGTEGLAEVVERFGEDVLDREGRLVRERLAAIVFDDADAREDLNAIVHPRVRQRIAERLAEIADDPGTGEDQIVVLDVPLLAEGGASTDGYAVVIVVTAPEDVRVERLVRDRDMDPGDVRARAAAQASDEERRRIATHVIDNSGDLEALEREVEQVHTDIAGGGGT
jgi:dephospho-CoA kinase